MDPMAPEGHEGICLRADRGLGRYTGIRKGGVPAALGHYVGHREGRQQGSHAAMSAGKPQAPGQTRHREERAALPGWIAQPVALQRIQICQECRTLLRGRLPVSYVSVRNSILNAMSMWHQRGGGNRFTHDFGPTRARVRFVDHHLAHAISAYAFSGFADSIATAPAVTGAPRYFSAGSIFTTPSRRESAAPS